MVCPYFTKIIYGGDVCILITNSEDGTPIIILTQNSIKELLREWEIKK